MEHSAEGSMQAADARLQHDPGHAQTIQASHERCAAFGLGSHQAPDLHRLDNGALSDLQLRNSRLCAQALPVMEMLYDQLSYSQSMVLLTDASGVVLHALGDAGFLQRAQQVALAPGALWAEADKGTNAVGTALMREAPTLVHGSEHYLRAMHFLTCSAAPIFDHKGELLGVLDVSGERRSHHPHTLALATMAARLVELQWFTERFRHHTRLRFHPEQTTLGTLGEAQLVLNSAGHVLGANRQALELLAMAAPALRRKTLADLFGMSLGEAIDASRSDSGFMLPRDGLPTFHALLSPGSLGQNDEVRPPDEVIGIAVPPLGAQQSLRSTEAQAIQAAVQASGGNLSVAARALGIGRSTLYRKLRLVQP